MGIEDGQAFFYELYDLLRPGGILLVVDGNGVHREDCKMRRPAAFDPKIPAMQECCQQEDETAPVSSDCLSALGRRSCTRTTGRISLGW